jgi:ABC-2 type transport system permease protein
MTLTLLRKTLRDLRWPLLVVALLLLLFQFLWAKITDRLCVQVLPVLRRRMDLKEIEALAFRDTGKLMQIAMGGENIHMENATDMLSVGYVHPLVLTIFCLWAIGRSAGAIVGEVDRGTMELLLGQPVARYKVVLAHLVADVMVIPVLCLSLWVGSFWGTWAFGLLRPEGGEAPPTEGQPVEVFEMVLRGNVEMLYGVKLPEPEMSNDWRYAKPWVIGPGLVNAAAFIFAVTGYTMWLSSLGRFRGRVLGVAVLVTLVQYLANVLGQLVESLAFLRPFTVFYYYQPQEVMLNGNWTLDLGGVWNDGAPLVWVYPVAVLLTVGAVGYGLAFWTFGRRDLPAPL